MSKDVTRHSPFYTAEHVALADTVRRFVEREITPNVQQWEEAGAFPRELYSLAGSTGLLGLGFPEEYGGTPGDGFARLLLTLELTRSGSGGIVAGLMSHGIGLPPIVALGSKALKDRVVAAVVGGEMICALAITEPEGGSDVAQLAMSARRDGDDYVLRGSKTFITSGMRADLITVAARTGGPGAQGVSLFAVETARCEGIERTSLPKMGWWCSDTATLHFDDVRVGADALLGAENAGFLGIMQNFNHERLSIATMALGFSEVCYEEAVQYARLRATFGKPLIKHQVIRHKLVDMRQRIEALRASIEVLTWRVDRRQWPIAEVCMLKNQATQCFEFCAKEAVQIFGGAGYIRGAVVERLYRETKVLAIGGGAEEVMKELAGRQLGL